MANAFRSSATAEPPTTTSWVVSKPSGVASGDVLLAFLNIDEGFTNTLTISGLPSGWAEITGSPTDNGAYYNRSMCAYKVAGGSEGSDYTFTISGSATGFIACLAYSGVDSGAVFDITPAVFTKGGFSTTNAFASMSPVTADCMLVQMVGASTYGSGGMTADGSMTERVDLSAAYHSLFVADQLLSGSSATGTRTHTATASDRTHGFSILLRPSSGGGSIVPQAMATYRMRSA